MSKFLTVAVASLTLVSPAYATCEDYAGGPAPRAILCYKGRCDDTTVNVTCSSVIAGFHREYANGLIISAKPNGDMVFSNSLGKKMNRADWTCKEIGTSLDGACW
jgi:hypothetical protein